MPSSGERQLTNLKRAGVILSVLTAMSLTTVAAAGDLPRGGTFLDDDGNVHEANIEAIAAKGITKGCNPPTNDLYCPDSSVTRGQMAAFLVRALGLPATDTDFFIDDDGSLFEFDINRLAAAGITKGCNPPSNDRYCPDQQVTREQMAAFLVRAFGYTDAGGGGLFTDTKDTIFAADIDRLATAGVTKGCNPPDNDRYCPKSFVLRSQMASFLGRALGLAPMKPPPGFIGDFEGIDPDLSNLTLEIGPTGSDRAVHVRLFDDGGSICLANFGEMSAVTVEGTGKRLDAVTIEITADVVCHTSGGDKVTPASPITGTWNYDPVSDVVISAADGACLWRSDGGSASDCP